MPQYLVAIHHPDDYDPSVEGEAMQRNIAALNDEIEAADVRIFVGGLAPARSDLALRAQPGVVAPRGGAASLLPSGITWLIENRGHP